MGESDDMRMQLRVFYCLASLVMGLAFEGGASAAIDIAVLSGTASPDGNGAFSLFNAPTVNSAGQLAFVGQLTGTAGGTTDNVGMFRYETNSSLTTISRFGQTFNGKPIIAYFPGSGYIDSTGTVTSVIAIGPPNEFWHTLGSGGALTGMHTAGMPSPSGQSNALLGVNTLTVNDSGLAVYRAIFNGPQPEAGLYQRTADGTHSVRVLQNTTAPRGGTINGFGSRSTLNETGQIGVTMTVDVGSNISSAVKIDGTTVVELVRQGDLIGDGITTIGQFQGAASFINTSGQVAFAARYTQPSISAQGVFLADGSGTTLVAPGILPGWSTGTNDVQVLGLSDTGRAALHTEFLGGFDPMSGIYLTGPGGPSIVAFEDNATPNAGKYFRRFLTGSVTINATGQMAFMAELSDTVNGAAAGSGLYFYDPLDGLSEIARVGDSFNGSTISSVFFNGMVNSVSTMGPDRSLSGLNDAGEVGFAFALANGQRGVAVFSPSSTPGDYTGDGLVNEDDYDEWKQNFGAGATDADGNSDGSTDAADYVVWRKHDGGAGAGGVGDFQSPAVPEPSSFALAVVSTILASWSRIRRVA
jgi:hypothetical protein